MGKKPGLDLNSHLACGSCWWHLWCAWMHTVPSLLGNKWLCNQPADLIPFYKCGDISDKYMASRIRVSCETASEKHIKAVFTLQGRHPAGCVSVWIPRQSLWKSCWQERRMYTWEGSNCACCSVPSVVTGIGVDRWQKLLSRQKWPLEQQSWNNFTCKFILWPSIIFSYFWLLLCISISSIIFNTVETRVFMLLSTVSSLLSCKHLHYKIQQYNTIYWKWGCWK